MGKNGLILPSTKEFVRQARLRGTSFIDLLHGYFYGRWTFFYIAMGTGRHPLAKRLAPLLNWIGGLIVSSAGKDNGGVKMEDTYHGKVLPLEAARQLVSVKQPIPLGDLEHVIPYALARDLVLQNPDHIVALECPCRAAKPNPCLPLDVCLIVGEPFAGFTIEHHPTKAHWISSEEAQGILQAEDKRGHVHHAFFKDAMLGRFYAICNCCSCCCGAMQAQKSGTPMLASSGYVAQVQDELCLACKRCERTCPFGAIQVNGKAVIDTTACMGCGVCLAQCKPGALELVRMESKGDPLEIHKLIEEFQASQATGGLEFLHRTLKDTTKA